MSASTTPQTAAPDAMTCSSVVIADLKAWLQGHGVSLEHFGIHYYGPEEGHGVVAAKAFVQGEHTLDIPFRLTMNVHSALASDLAAVFSNETNLADIEILALHLMYEKQKGTASFWAPFIRSLPATFDTPIFWTDEPFNALKGTNVSLLASMMKQQIVADYTSIHTPIFQKYPALFHRASLTMQEYKWALSVIWSRAFGITKGGQYLQVLCPAMDMFNHDVLLNRPLDDFIVFDEQTQMLCHRLHVDCVANTPLHICYGPYSNAKLLYSYGFVVPGNARRGIDFWVNVPTNDPYYKLKKMLLDSNDMTAHQTYDFEGTLLGSTVSERLLAMARIVLMQEDEIHARNNAFHQAVISRRNEIAVYDSLTIACRRKLQAFTTTLEDDIATLAAGNLSQQMAFALQVRIEDKQVLEDTIGTLAKWKAYLVAHPDENVYPPRDCMAC
ncbi:hypothetical protein H310_05635 [Aphanomyces invadans]|uniref:Rubisco LSMT substrate-binding domain-containing protein n=1 Tax=Aphanomyces invadans TaxID=157072 RepID=A0A024U9Y8_9STRA|nr:hypothetical protein H310_05635 [Aphanomyces invadans]ETW03236.1 hypothetical protein H310_05635 [Aphanomyces invadans]|eukprot:XP_008868620.1 hypothetical protein H310_05635 [Aphanomyces invadans]